MGELKQLSPLKPKSTKTKKRFKPQVNELPGYEQHLKALEQKNVTYRETASTISEDGEILEQNYKTISKPKEDEFIKLYLSDLGYFHQLQPNQQELLYFFLRKMNYDNLIVVNKTINEMIAKESGKSFSTVKNALTTYVEKGILIRRGTGVYVANPFLFGKGRFEDIHQIRMELIYSNEGILLRSHIEKRDENDN